MDPLLEKLASIEARYNSIDELMADPELASDYTKIQELAKEKAVIQDLVAMYRQYSALAKEKDELEDILSNGADNDLMDLAKEELGNIEKTLTGLNQQLRTAILPKDPNDQKDVIVEIREGVGGVEASLFVADIFRMYSRYAANHNWKIEILNSSPSEKTGLKEVIFEIQGEGVFSKLKFERGAHRVQRVPKTEASGRIHTSTATVAVLPEVDTVDIDINPEDLRIDIYHASGAGGQNVNKVSTAVRIVHLPTNTVAVCQDERSQFKNRQKAMAILRARIYEMEQQRQQAEISQTRRSQVGTGERAEKIRTYNFPQDRITDHRINFTTHGVQRILDGDIDEIIEALSTREQAELLEATIS